jgi:hypothetical protein
MLQHQIRVQDQLATFVTAARDWLRQTPKGRVAQILNRTALLSLSTALMGAQMAPVQALVNSEAIKLAAVDAVPLPRPTGSKLPSGVYLFGESAQRQQIGKAYMVFEVKDKVVTGAVYWPQSSFDCFEGRFSQEQLSLRVTETYSREVYTHAIAVAPDTSILASNNLKTTPVELGLTGMHRIATGRSRLDRRTPATALTADEARILKACQAQ